MSLGLAFPIPAEELSMPSEQGVWLRDQDGILPGTNQLGQQNEQETIDPSYEWPFHLPPEDDELLAEENIFRDQFGLASAEIGQGCQWQ